MEDWTGVVYHYDGSGLYLGFTNITAPEESPTSFRGFTYAAYNASSLIPRGGGAMCYVPASANGDGISTLAYGASYVSQLPAAGNECDNLLVEETFLVRTAPGAGESYSRVGRGVEPEDYMWQVTEATPGVYNGGQVVPNSCSRDNLCRRGNRYRQATFLMHRRRGGECEVRCVSKSKVGYMQMYGWACGECEEEETEPPEEGATDEPEEENKGFTGIWD